MKIAICQINPTVGAIVQNQQLIKSFYSKSLDKEADLVVFPELAISGYPLQDLLLRQNFLRNVMMLLWILFKDALSQL